MKNYFMLGIAIVSFVCWVSPAWALFGEKKADLLKDSHITLVQAVDKALSNAQGKAVSAELEKEDGKTVFEVKIIDETGNKIEIYVDAHSGDVVKIEKD
ncbi:MAG: hypothetical protein NPIRA04_03030 [Nitrospirales bacterium]|nr:MAG: hypothetical protein NPIRA04_03030 [Nitrospirales bacterium]